MRHWKKIPTIFKIVQALDLKLGLLFFAHISGVFITNCHFLLLLEMVDVLVIIILLKVPLNVFLLSLVSPEILVLWLAPRLSITQLWCFVELVALGLMWMLWFFVRVMVLVFGLVVTLLCLGAFSQGWCWEDS